MDFALDEFGLKIDSPLSIPTAQNFRPPSWPPPRDWPVVVDAQGVVVSRYGDPVWRMEPWIKGRWCLNFGDGPRIYSEPIDHENANLLRQIVAWWLWGPRGVRNVSTLMTRLSKLRPLFVVISKSGIKASSLSRFPVVVAKLAEVIPASGSANLLTYLHELYGSRKSLGFTLLDKNGLVLLASLLPEHDRRQTPYIPPRIWKYQVTRLANCLSEFMSHREQVEACYRFCLDAYANNYGTLTRAMAGPADCNKSPFSKREGYYSLQGLKFYGAFEQTAARYGILDLLRRWIGEPCSPDNPLCVSSLGRYLNLISKAGIAYILNFSLMRISEALELRSDCLHVENDPKFGQIYIIQGVTKKVFKDNDARWPTSPSTKMAVEAMTHVAHLKLICASAHPQIRLSKDEITNPFLVQRCLEPWVKTPKEGVTEPLRRQSYDIEITRRFPYLFQTEELRITEEDAKLARLVNPSLDSDKYAVGSIWIFAYHQLRRTGSVNMQASGLISDASMQYLLKHSTRAMSLYYGQGFSRLRLNDESRDLYVRTMYEVLGREFANLLSDRFVSPHGEKRKAEIVRLINPNDAKKLATLAAGGQVSCRQIIFGYCLNREPCPFGGIDTVAHCGGGDSSRPCPDALYDREALKRVERLQELVDERLSKAPAKTPLRASLLAQKKSIENYIDATKPKQFEG